MGFNVGNNNDIFIQNVNGNNGKKTNNLVEFDGTANMKEPNNAISF